jgi:uncharacterized protein
MKIKQLFGYGLLIKSLPKYRVSDCICVWLILVSLNASAQYKAKLTAKNPQKCLPTPTKITKISMKTQSEKSEKNVLQQPLQQAGTSPRTGFYRDGFCSTGPDDLGVHVVASVVTDEFLQFSKSRGNDLITPYPLYDFPGLKAGDKWCLCASRWREALNAGVAPPVILEATHEKALDFVSLEDLKTHQAR